MKSSRTLGAKCLTDEGLQAYVESTVAGLPTSPLVDHHLESCSHCRQRAVDVAVGVERGDESQPLPLEHSSAPSTIGTRTPPVLISLAAILVLGVTAALFVGVWPNGLWPSSTLAANGATNAEAAKVVPSGESKVTPEESNDRTVVQTVVGAPIAPSTRIEDATPTSVQLTALVPPVQTPAETASASAPVSEGVPVIGSLGSHALRAGGFEALAASAYSFIETGVRRRTIEGTGVLENEIVVLSITLKQGVEGNKLRAVIRRNGATLGVRECPLRYRRSGNDGTLRALVVVAALESQRFQHASQAAIDFPSTEAMGFLPVLESYQPVDRESNVTTGREQEVCFSQLSRISDDDYGQVIAALVEAGNVEVAFAYLPERIWSWFREGEKK